jgi:alkylation response protein AidB-like acyl-CoA dehydrogenase
MGTVRAKYWLTELETKIVQSGLQLFGHCGYRSEYSISHRYRDQSVRRLYAGTHEIMKVLIARSL